MLTTYGLDSMIDPAHGSFTRDLARFSDLTGENVESWTV